MKPGVVDRIGNYRIDAERSRDAAGVVYQAHHLVLPRRAILKVMHEDRRPAAIQLLREACILEALEHPGIIRVYESGLLPDRRPWFAHERVEGATVGDLLITAPLEPSSAASLLRDIADILEHTHRRGVIHCGIRPDRIVVTRRARGFPICIVDWTNARIHDTTAPLPAIGPVDYAAPELINGESVDDTADVFALGVIAYQALTGELPFDGVWVATVADGTVQHTPAQVRCPDAPAKLTALIDQMLAWDRWDRPSVAEVRVELAVLATELATADKTHRDALRIRRPKWTPPFRRFPTQADAGSIPVEVIDDKTNKST
jgi:serine/threonine protein kinase